MAHVDFLGALHNRTKRDYVGRMMDEKVHCMLKAKEYEADYWDGDRRYGYGGYRYLEGRWKPVAAALIDLYGLKGKCRILDVGCGKGFLLREFKLLLPEAELVGFDVSRHGLAGGAKGQAAPGFHFHEDQCVVGLVPADQVHLAPVRRAKVAIENAIALPAQVLGGETLPFPPETAAGVFLAVSGGLGRPGEKIGDESGKAHAPGA